MKTGKRIAFIVMSILAGGSFYTTQLASEPDRSVQESMPPLETSDLYSTWLEKNKGYQKPSEDQLKQTLSKVQFDVTQEEGTERPFKNAYWDNKQQGIYVDIVSGEPLYSSTDKFVSGTGWPSFSQAISHQAMVEKEDRSFFRSRTEIRSAVADSHLGHVFDDGPAPTGKRYCINSASLRFIAKEDLVKEGYGEFSKLFE